MIKYLYFFIHQCIMAAKRTIPLVSMEKILKACGAERVSDDAKIALREILEEVADEISGNAAKLAEHAGRRTVMSSDIKLAAR
jgi:histone H3/H4